MVVDEGSKRRSALDEPFMPLGALGFDLINQRYSALLVPSANLVSKRFDQVPDSVSV
ncbi:hypothetical protein CHELA1G2_13064 [Hyphomicrobiales bacterium]|nr:hypothetical protein CHELA1G2_13064 [Hyphomicrobiales bacterium]